MDLFQRCTLSLGMSYAGHFRLQRKVYENNMSMRDRPDA